MAITSSKNFEIISVVGCGCSGPHSHANSNIRN